MTTPCGLHKILRPGDAHAARSSTALLYANVALTYVNRHLYADGVRYAGRGAELVRFDGFSARCLASCLSVSGQCTPVSG